MDNFPYGATTFSLIFTKRDISFNQVNEILYYLISNEKVVTPYGNFSFRFAKYSFIQNDNFLNCLCLGIKCCYPQHKLSLFLVGYDATITVCNKEFSGVKDETCVCLCCLLPIKAPSMVVVLAILVYLQCVSMGVSSISSQKSRPPEVLAPLCLRSHV